LQEAYIEIQNFFEISGRIDSDEEEYDSELDDFIDDGDPDLQPEDVSKVISEIFKYDKNK